MTGAEKEKADSVVSRSSKKKKNRKKRARQWTGWVENLKTTIDCMYEMCRSEQSVAGCREAMLYLQSASNDFKSLIETINVEKEWEEGETAEKRPSVAWEVRKSMCSPNPVNIKDKPLLPMASMIAEAVKNAATPSKNQLEEGGATNKEHLTYARITAAAAVAAVAVAQPEEGWKVVSNRRRKSTSSTTVSEFDREISVEKEHLGTQEEPLNVYERLSSTSYKRGPATTITRTLTCPRSAMDLPQTRASMAKMAYSRQLLWEKNQQVLVEKLRAKQKREKIVSRSSSQCGFTFADPQAVRKSVEAFNQQKSSRRSGKELGTGGSQVSASELQSINETSEDGPAPSSEHSEDVPADPTPSSSISAPLQQKSAPGSLFGYLQVPEELEKDVEWRTMTEEEESLALEENSLKLEIKQAESMSIDAELERQVEAEAADLEREEKKRKKEKQREAEKVSIENFYKVFEEIRSLAWSEMMEQETQQQQNFHEPGTPVEKHEKMSSPSRRRCQKDDDDFGRRHEQKQKNAEALRAQLQEAKALKLKELTSRVEEVRAKQEALKERKRRLLEERMARAAENRDRTIMEVIRKAKDDDQRVAEVKFIATLQEDTKKSDLMQIAEGRTRKQEDRKREVEMARKNKARQLQERKNHEKTAKIDNNVEKIDKNGENPAKIDKNADKINKNLGKIAETSGKIDKIAEKALPNSYETSTNHQNPGKIDKIAENSGKIDKNAEKSVPISSETSKSSQNSAKVDKNAENSGKIDKNGETSGKIGKNAKNPGDFLEYLKSLCSETPISPVPPHQYPSVSASLPRKCTICPSTVILQSDLEWAAHLTCSKEHQEQCKLITSGSILEEIKRQFVEGFEVVEQLKDEEDSVEKLRKNREKEEEEVEKARRILKDIQVPEAIPGPITSPRNRTKYIRDFNLSMDKIWQKTAQIDEKSQESLEKSLAELVGAVESELKITDAQNVHLDQFCATNGPQKITDSLLEWTGRGVSLRVCIRLTHAFCTFLKDLRVVYSVIFKAEMLKILEKIVVLISSKNSGNSENSAQLSALLDVLTVILKTVNQNSKNSKNLKFKELLKLDAQIPQLLEGVQRFLTSSLTSSEIQKALEGSRGSALSTRLLGVAEQVSMEILEKWGHVILGVLYTSEKRKELTPPVLTMICGSSRILDGILRKIERIIVLVVLMEEQMQKLMENVKNAKFDENRPWGTLNKEEEALLKTIGLLDNFVEKMEFWQKRSLMISWTSGGSSCLQILEDVPLRLLAVGKHAIRISSTVEKILDRFTNSEKSEMLGDVSADLFFNNSLFPDRKINKN